MKKTNEKKLARSLARFRNAAYLNGAADPRCCINFASAVESSHVPTPALERVDRAESERVNRRTICQTGENPLARWHRTPPTNRPSSPTCCPTSSASSPRTSWSPDSPAGCPSATPSTSSAGSCTPARTWSTPTRGDGPTVNMHIFSFSPSRVYVNRMRNNCNKTVRYDKTFAWPHVKMRH